MAAKATDGDRLESLFQLHYVRVLNYARRRTDIHTAQDVASEVFLVAWRHLGAVPEDAVGWFIATTRFVLANHRRSRDRQAALRLRLAGERPADEPSPDDRLDASARWSRALASLSSSDQEVLALVAWDGLTNRQAAASLGCRETAFGMRLSRARRRLVKALDTQQSRLQPDGQGRPLPERTQP